MSEAQRIKEAYARRDASGKRGMYTMFSPSSMAIIQGRERALLRRLKRAGLDDLKDRRILEVGCGTK